MKRRLGTFFFFLQRKKTKSTIGDGWKIIYLQSEMTSDDAPPPPQPSLVEQGNSPIEESHFLCSGGLRQVRRESN